MVPQKCLYWQKLESVSKDRPPKYGTILENYSYHRMLFYLLDKHELQDLIRESFSANNNYVMIEHDYDEALKA